MVEPHISKRNNSNAKPYTPRIITETSHVVDGRATSGIDQSRVCGLCGGSC